MIWYDRWYSHHDPASVQTMKQGSKPRGRSLSNVSIWQYGPWVRWVQLGYSQERNICNLNLGLLFLSLSFEIVWVGTIYLSGQWHHCLGWPCDDIESKRMISCNPKTLPNSKVPKFRHDPFLLLVNNSAKIHLLLRTWSEVMKLLPLPRSVISHPYIYRERERDIPVVPHKAVADVSE